MPLKAILISLILSSVCLTTVRGQQTDSALLYNDPYIAELDSLLNESGSSDFLKLMDSLINLPAPTIKSQLITRLGYNSNVVSASRTLGFNQFGMAPGISYYHKSGLYVDATGYWSKEYEPNYYLTVGTIGYLNSPTTWWSFMTEYSRYMYSKLNDGEYIAYKNNIGASNFFDVGLFTFRLDYQFYFGDKIAHRINPSIMLNLRKTNLGKIDRIAFYPTFSTLFGSEQITETIPYARTLLGILYRVRNHLPLYYEKTTTEFGVLNYSLVAPVAITLKHWTFIVSYTYNIPKSLPGETINLVDTGYLSASISKRITF
ncbi:MAG: hypothetical protein JNM78_06705 [Cyclobacteriaceae bacterium]|nr:hypothetical protein [Cyclobacteriaceae bacterium]